MNPGGQESWQGKLKEIGRQIVQNNLCLLSSGASSGPAQRTYEAGNGLNWTQSPEAEENPLLSDLNAAGSLGGGDAQSYQEAVGLRQGATEP